MQVDPNVFIELSLIILISVVVSGIITFLKQPLIIGYILSGILVSPSILNIVKSTDAIGTFAHIGIAILLFMVGLNLNPKMIKDVGKVAMITGLGQVIFTSVIGYLIGIFLGFSTITAIYVAIALTFSSTIIIMKLLTDKGDTDKLYGRISIGFLIVQDLVVIIILMVISAVPSNVDFATFALESITYVLGLLLTLTLFVIYVLPKLMSFVTKSQEYLFLFSIAWCFSLAAIFYFLNFSIEVGALLAGITLSTTPYRYEIASKMKPLRDFFIVLFFIFLGSQMVFSNITQYIIPIIIFSLFILIGNPLIVMVLMGLMGYTKRNSFLSGLTVAQISEFSLILITLGVNMGHLSTEVLSFVTVIGLVTIGGSSYMIVYSNKIYAKLSKYLGVFEKKGKKVDEHKYHKSKSHDVILFGYNRTAYDVLASLKKMKKKSLIIDYDPEVIVKLAKEGYDCKYGDADDFEMLNELNFSKAKMVVSTIPDIDTNLLLINRVREENEKAIITVMSHQIDDAIKLYDEGASYVIIPHLLGGRHMSTLIEENKLNVRRFLKEKMTHVEYLKTRRHR